MRDRVITFPKAVAMAVAIQSAILCMTAGARAAEPVGLAEAYRLAVSNDPKLASVERRAESERYRVDEARGQLYPHVSADASYVLSRYERNVVERDPLTLEIDQTIEEQDQNSYSWGVTLEQPIFDLERFQRLDYAHQRVGLADAEVVKEQQGVAERTAEGMFRLLLARRALSLAQAEVTAYEARVEQQQKWLAKGLSTRADFLDAKVRLQQAQSALITAENDLELARLNLERLTGQDLADRVVSVGAESAGRLSLQQRSPRKWVAEAMEFNPDIRIARQSLSVAREETDIARAKRYPTVALQARYSDTNSLDQVIGGEDKRVYLQARVPIFQGGALRAGVNAAQASRAGRVQDVRDAERQAELTIRETLNTFLTAEKRADSLLDSLETAEAFLEAAEASHRLGLKDFVEVLDARARLFEIRRDIAQTLFDQVVAYVQLLGASGRLTPVTLSRLDQQLGLTAGR